LASSTLLCFLERFSEAFATYLGSDNISKTSSL
jgi:hypothetical protein